MAGRILNISGTAYVQPLDSDMKPTGGFFAVGQLYPLTIEVTKSNVTLPSGLRGQRGVDARAKSKIDKIEASGTFRELIGKTAAMLLAAEIKENTFDAGTESITDFVIPEDGSWGDLPHTKISAVKVGGSAVTADYEVNARLGMIRVSPTKDATERATLSGAKAVEYAFAKGAGNKIAVGKSATTRWALKVDGKDEDSGEDCVVYIPSGVFSASGSFAVIEDPETDFPNWECAIALESVPGEEAVAYIDGVSLGQWADA